MGKRAGHEAVKGREGLLIQEGSAGNVPSGKLVANVIVILSSFAVWVVMKAKH